MTDRLRVLSVVVGKWASTWEFHDPELQPEYRQQFGTYKISWTLDSTYLRWESERHPANNAFTRFMLVLTSYNTDSARYEENFFYGGSALKVVTTGQYDPTHRELVVQAFIPREDGEHDEHVRSIMRIVSRNEIVYEHFSRYTGEEAERHDLTITMRRLR